MPALQILGLLLCLVVIVTPILAILAFTRVQKLAEQLQAARLNELIARVYSLEQRIASIREGKPAPKLQQPDSQAVPETLPGATPAPPSKIALPSWPAAPLEPAAEPPKMSETAATIPRAPSLHPPHLDASSGRDLEVLIAGSWFNRVGILAVIVAVSLFLKYAFDNNWIGPSGRVAIGILLGAAMLPWSQWLLGRGYSYFSEGIAALGQATLLLSIWAGCRYYTLFSTNAGFAGMIVVSVVMAVVALGRNSERIALLSLLGGFLTPLLLSTGKDEEIVLFAYLLILGAGLLVIAARRDWRTLAPVSFLCTQLYFWGWYDTFYRPAKVEPTIVFATLFFFLYFALPVLRAVGTSALESVELFVVLLNSFAYLGALYLLLWPKDRWTLTVLVLALSAAHLGVARLVRSGKTGEWPVAQQFLAGLAFTFATLAIPIRLEGKWITLALGVEGALMVRTGFRSQAALLRRGGLFLLAVAALRVLFIPLPAPQFLLNERFATYAGVIVCMVVVLFSAREHTIAPDQEKSLAPERSASGVLAVVINVYALVALSLELWDYFGRTASLGIDRGLAQHLALSLLWTAYASMLIVIGIQRRSPLLRWQSLTLFGLVVLKVFLYDSSYLDRVYRILSFLVLGLVLLVVSFLYQNRTSRERTPS
jgi:uncharacterized membrane protein